MILIGISIMILVGCGRRDVITSNNIAPSSGRFIDTHDSYKVAGWTYDVYYDSKTNIVYIASGNLNASGITIMYDKDGKPMTLDTYNKTK